MTDAAKSMDDIMALCKRRGFVYQASEIYGGINGFWDYGPLGAQLKKNLRDAWWHDCVLMGCNGQTGPNGKPVRLVPVDSCIVQNPKVWEASGHVGGFNDPMVDDKETKQRFRADHFFGVFFSPAPKDVQREQAAANFAAKVDKDWSVFPAVTIVAGSLGEAAAIFNDKAKSLCKAARVNYKGHEVTGDLDVDFVIEGSDAIQLVKIDEISQSRLSTDHQREQIPSPFTQQRGTLTEPRAFNLMFKTYVGATSAQTDENAAYLRPETAQGIFINFKNVMDTTRVRVPFGIAQTGKAFRNEVTPRNFTFRSREFEQMEIEFFCHPEDAKEWYTFWRDWRMQWWQELGLAGDNLILREHDSDELAHYAKDGAGTSDVEYRFPFTAPGYGELEGIAHRTDFDLRQHAEHAGAKLEYFDQERNERYLPHVIEPSAGLDRGVLAALCEAYTPDESRASKVYMKFHPRLAPIKAAVFPLVNKDGMPETGEELHRELVARFGAHGFIEYDPKQSIGKRYARMDEAGCPFCITIDGDTAGDRAVTVRHRDTQEQERVPLDRVGDFLAEKLGL